MKAGCFVKETVAEKGGAVVGVHIVGPRASDLITEAQLVTSWEAYPSELAELMHPHPTLSEAIGETRVGRQAAPRLAAEEKVRVSGSCHRAPKLNPM
jgi:electron transfer flavoprotein alpha subunit